MGPKFPLKPCADDDFSPSVTGDQMGEVPEPTTNPNCQLPLL